MTRPFSILTLGALLMFGLSACIKTNENVFLMKVDGQAYQVATTSSYIEGSNAKLEDVWQVTVGNETAICAAPTNESCARKIRELLGARKAQGFGKPKPAKRTALPGLTPPYPVIEPEGDGG